MSTNFDAYFPEEKEIRHLGQRAYGWRFLHRAYPEIGIVDIESWMAQLDRAEWIRDEYGREYDVGEFRRAVAECQNGRPRDRYSGADWTDPEGHCFSAAEFC